jgi:hypothetical protein
MQILPAICVCTARDPLVQIILVLTCYACVPEIATIYESEQIEERQ